MSGSARAAPVALTIAGSDPSGGAGIQADLKTFHRFGVFGASAITLVTAQNSRGVCRVDPLPAPLVAAQIQAVVEDLPVAAVKTGALGTAAIVEATARALSRAAPLVLVVDPVLRPTRGIPLLDQDALAPLKLLLLPRATLITPNLHEAAVLSGVPIDTEHDVEKALRALRELGPSAVLVTGGHAEGPSATDWLYDGHEVLRFEAPRIDTPHTHGTGCTLSAAITARLALGDPLPRAVRAAKAYLCRALRAAPGLGRRRGPLNHWV